MKAFSALALGVLSVTHAARLSLKQPAPEQLPVYLPSIAPAPAPAGPPQVVLPAHRGHSMQHDPLAECFVVPDSICVEDGAGLTFVSTPPLVRSDLVIWYQFDKNLPVDDSGHMHHLTDSEYALTPLPVGPGIMGRGGSAAFDGRSYRVIKSTDAVETPDATITLWVYLTEDSMGSWRTIFNKATSSESLKLALLLWPDQRRMHVRASPRADMSDGVIDSTSLLPLRRWTHITVTCTESVLRLYVNGILDGEIILEGMQMTGGGDIHLGRDPWRAGIKGYLDDFRWYTRALTHPEIRALTFPSLTGMGIDEVHLGCSSCRFPEAVKSCGTHAHLCSLQELLTGGFHTARAMGWLSQSPEIWYHNEEGDDLFSNVKKLGLCCAN